MVALPPAWPEFMATVEGRESPESCVLVDGLPVISLDRVPQGAAPNLAMLVSFLRSDRHIPPGVRAWLANMLDNSADSILRLEPRKRHARPKRALDAGWEEVAYFNLMRETTHRKKAIFATMEKFDMSKSALEDAIARHATAEGEANRIEREDGPK